MANTTLAQLYRKVKSGLTLQAAIDETIPGADPEFWRPLVARYDPDRPKAKQRRRRSAHQPRRQTFHASHVLTITALALREIEARATVELINRVNSQEV